MIHFNVSHPKPDKLDSSPYAPFPIDSPASLGLSRRVFESTFGRLAYWVGGDASPTAHILLHGVGGSSSSWTPFLRALAVNKERRLGKIILVDLPGFGESQNMLRHLDATRVSHTLVDLARSERVDEVRLVGHSMGGYLALHAATLNLGAIKSVFVVSGTYLSIVDAVKHPAYGVRHSPGTVAAFEGMRALSVLGRLAPVILHGMRSAGLLELLMSRSIARPKSMPGSFYDSVVTGLRPASFLLAAQNGKTYDPTESWPGITVPVRALFGDHDSLVPIADYERVRRQMRNIDALLLHDCGHFGTVERPYEVVESITNFLDRTLDGAGHGI